MFRFTFGATVIALTGNAFRVFVGQARTQRLQNSIRREILNANGKEKKNRMSADVRCKNATCQLTSDAMNSKQLICRFCSSTIKLKISSSACASDAFKSNADVIRCLSDFFFFTD
jgi:hypothetical protein